MIKSNSCAQSPIDVKPNVFSSKRKPLQLKLKWKKVKGTPEWDEHGMKVTFQEPYSTSVLDGTTYYLRQFHFHHPSEHYLDGTKFDAEVHLVHKTKDEGKALVIGIFLQIEKNKKAKELDKPFFETLSRLSQLQDHQEEIVPLRPINWIPKNTRSAIRYEGSITTPEYEEIVSWVILGVQPISKKQYDYIFRDTDKNARELQDLNRRFVVKYRWKP